MNPPRLYFSHPTHDFGDEAHALDTEMRIRGFREGGYIDVKGCMTKGYMSRAIKECSIFVIELAPRLLDSKWMQLELASALANKKPIAAIVHQETPIDDLEAFLRKTHQILIQKQPMDIDITWEDFRSRFPEKPIQFDGCIGSAGRDEMFKQILRRGSEVFVDFLRPLRLPPIQVLVVGNPAFSSGPCNVIALELCRRGFGAIATNHCWTKQQHVFPEFNEAEASLVVFLTVQCWSDRSVVERVRGAIQKQTPMMFFIEKDRNRKGWCSIEEAIHSAPADIRPVFDEIHIVGFSFDSRSTFLEVMLDHIEDNLRLKTFAAFLSHHKGGVKSEVRLIKDRLQAKLESTRADYTKVFLDVDNALRLDELEQYVKGSKALVLLLTKDTLTRPWVLVELVSALLWRIPIVTVHFTGYDFSRVRSSLENLSPQSEEILKSMFPETTFEEIQYLLATAPVGMILSQEYDSMANEVTLALFIERLVKRLKDASYVAPVISRSQWNIARMKRLQSFQHAKRQEMVLSALGIMTFAIGTIAGMSLSLRGWRFPAFLMLNFPVMPVLTPVKLTLPVSLGWHGWFA